MDDTQRMTREQLLDAIQDGFLRDLARTLQRGSATHQELAIARGLLRDNKRLIPATENDADPNLPEQGRAGVPQREFPEYGDHDE